MKNHVVAFARALQPAPRTIQLTIGEQEREITTTAATVGEALREAGIIAAEGDAVSPSLDTPISDGLTIDYRAAFPVTLIVGGQPQEVRTAARTVADLLVERDVALAPIDRVSPARDTPLSADAIVRVSRVVEWTKRIREQLAPLVVHRLDPDLAPTVSKTIARGRPAVRERLLRYRRADDDVRIERAVIETRVLAAGRPKVVASGILAYEHYLRIAGRAARGTVRLANAAIRVLATAYTPYCGGGCSGITALGTRAGYGIVAVDPGVIPLGTHLYIPGYGRAIAGDTGGAIRGRRIDLGFESQSDAIRFGTREIVVYVLR
ncbi:MAG: DUF348 domain-containing protein [Candidatus Eremiobacteraeota bacterium]|nr:DUF348 domain-containing protein [Candidatus Eremiobacteraeota bacterium]MBV8355529.1 DUF348 domain-containing protein [Candidatus Eremiobacteraeota bacterium]